MAIRDKYFPGTAVSRYLIPGERSWDEAVYQSGKPVLDSELILSQEVSKEIRRLVEDRTVPSGFLRGPSPVDPRNDFSDGVSPLQLNMSRRTALVANMPIVVEFTNTTTSRDNVIQFSAAPVFGGAPPDVKRADFVFLEVFRCVVSHSPSATAITTVVSNADVADGDQIIVNGVILTARAAAPVVDEYLIGVNEAATAANIATAISDPGNSFTGICTAQADVTIPEQVNLRAAPAFAGAAGNALTLVLGVQAVGGSTTINGGVLPTTFSGGADTANKPTQTTLYRHGNVDAPAGVNFGDDIADPVVGTESTKRVQIQYRIRVTGQSEAVNFKQENGFDNANVLAQGAQATPVAGYPFVPADGTTVSGTSSAANYQTVDPGLHISGDGSSAAATALGTVDGYVYAIPVCFVFRRNDAYNGGAGAGFDPLNNSNGALPSTHPGFVNPQIGAIPAASSDRPDGYFHDKILVHDILDLRRQVSPGGVDLKAELERQMTMLLDGELQTWAIDSADKNTLGAGSGDVATRFLVCNEIGRDGGAGGVAPSSGDTTRGDTVANFDHIRRRFADWPVVERRIFPIYPTDAQVDEPGKYVTKAAPGFLGWTEGDVIHLDLDNLDATGLGDWAHNPSGLPVPSGAVSSLWPPGTKVTNVLRVVHDDGHYTTAVPKEVLLNQVSGTGSEQILLTLAQNARQVNGGNPVNPDNDMVSTVLGGDTGSQRRIFIELEITYPVGSGTTDTVDEVVTPDATVYSYGTAIENDSSQRPADWENLLQPAFRESYRELAVEYVSNQGAAPGIGATITDFLVSDSQTQITLPRRIFGNNTTIETASDQITALPRNIDKTTTEYGSSSREVNLEPATPLSGAGQTLVQVSYFAQDPLPNYGAVGYQISCYYRSNAPQTVGVQAGAPVTWPLPDPVQVSPMVMSRDLWTGIAGAGSMDESFPYSRPMDQIAVNGDTPIGEFPAEWILEAMAEISVGDFDAATGLLNLHQMVPADPSAQGSFSDLDADQEFRAHYKVADTSTYRPTAMSQPLSSPVNHKVWFPFLARASSDGVFWRAGEVLLVVVSRYGSLDPDNTIVFTDSGNRTCAAIYRTSGLLIMASE